MKKKKIMIGSFVMIAVRDWLKDKKSGNVTNVKILCFVTIATNSSFTSISFQKELFQKVLVLLKLVKIESRNFNPVYLVEEE